MAVIFDDILKELADERKPLVVSKLAKLSSLTPERLKKLIPVWEHLSAERRRRLIREMVELAEDNLELEFEAVLKHALEDKDAQVRVGALEGLWETTDRHLLDKLIAMLGNDPAAEVRAATAVLLGRFAFLGEMGDLRPRDVTRIEEALFGVIENGAEELEVRRRAIEAVGVLVGEKETSLIETAYRSQEPKIRVSAVYAMGRNCDERWLPYLFESLESMDAEMRYEAAAACGELEDETAVPHLLPLLVDKDIEVRLSTIAALGHIGGQLAKKALRACLENADERIRDIAESALEEAEFSEKPLGLDLEF